MGRSLYGERPTSLWNEGSYPSAVSGCSYASGSQHDLNTFIFLIKERVEPLRRFTQLHAVGDDKARIDLTPLNPLQQFTPVALHVALTCSHRQAAVHERTHREFIDEPAIYADHGDYSAVPARHDGLAQCDGPIRFRHHRLFHTVVRVYDRVRAVCFQSNCVDAGIRSASTGLFH